MKYIFTAIVLTLAFAVSASAQQEVCISQEAANKCAENTRELEAQKNKIAVLEAALIEKDRLIEQTRITADKNIADLKAALSATEVKLATATGQIIECKAFAVRDAAIIEFLAKNQRSRQSGLINIKLGGN